MEDVTSVVCHNWGIPCTHACTTPVCLLARQSAGTAALAPPPAAASPNSAAAWASTPPAAPSPGTPAQQLAASDMQSHAGAACLAVPGVHLRNGVCFIFHGQDLVLIAANST